MPTESDLHEPTSKKEIAKNFAIGFGLVLALNAAVIGLFFGTMNWEPSGEIGPMVSTILTFVGLLMQPTFFIVAVVLALRKTKVGMASGLIAGSALTIMAIPATCFGLLFLSGH